MVGGVLGPVWPEENASEPNQRNISENGTAHIPCGLLCHKNRCGFNFLNIYASIKEFFMLYSNGTPSSSEK